MKGTTVSQTKEDIIRRIQALMGKTTAAGCSEAEALSAADAVSRLMNKYQLSMTDIKLKEEANCQEFDINVGYKVLTPVSFCCNAIAYLTDTQVWVRTDGKGTQHIVFFGFETDVTVAQYIYAVIDRAFLVAFLDYVDTSGYKNASPKQRLKMKDGFHFGMSGRISERLREMKDSQKRENSATGRDLVVVKSAIVRAEMEKLGLYINGSTKSSRRDYDTNAYYAGKDAGSKVAINPGVTGGGGSQGRLG